MKLTKKLYGKIMNIEPLARHELMARIIDGIYNSQDMILYLGYCFYSKYQRKHRRPFPYWRMHLLFKFINDVEISNG